MMRTCARKNAWFSFIYSHYHFSKLKLRLFTRKRQTIIRFYYSSFKNVNMYFKFLYIFLNQRELNELVLYCISSFFSLLAWTLYEHLLLRVFYLKKSIFVWYYKVIERSNVNQQNNNTIITIKYFFKIILWICY